MVYKKLSDNKITVECQISNGLIGKARNRGSLSQLNISKILLTYPDLNPDWLLTNRGRMLRSGKETKAIANSENYEFEVYEPMRIYHPSNSKEYISVESQLHKILHSKLQNVDFLVNVLNDTMLPVLSKNDIVLAKKLDLKDLTIQWNGLYVIETKDETFIKRIKQGSTSESIVLFSDNSFYNAIEIEMSKIKGIALVRDALRFLV